MVLDAVPSLGLRGFETATEAEAALSRAETYGTIVIPRDFTKDSLNGRGSTLELIINKSYYAVGTILRLEYLMTMLLEHGSQLVHLGRRVINNQNTSHEVPHSE